MDSLTPPPGPNLTLGVPQSDLAEGGLLVGHVGEAPVLLTRVGGVVRAVSALCTHYHGPLAEGLVVGDTVRCPWHHARFCLRTGEAIGAPAIDPIEVWTVEVRDGRLFVRDRAATPAPKAHVSKPNEPRRVVVVGGGAAGFAAVELLRREGFDGDVTLVGDDPDPPYDRPNCSKDFLAGKSPRAWMPLRPERFYGEQGITTHFGAKAGALDLATRLVALTDGTLLPFDALILATGAEPARPKLPGFDHPHVFTLRSLADAEAIIAAMPGARRAVIVGAGFIGLETAAALTERGLLVSVVAPDATPLEKVLGAEIGAYLRALHEAKGVVFYPSRTAAHFGDGVLVLDNGAPIGADLVIVGVGVTPRVDLAREGALAVDNGILVDGRLQTAVHGVFAAGDVARYPDPRSGALIRVEHWVAAARQGQHVARVLLGRADAFTDPPFFWSAHYDTTVGYVGHAAHFDRVEIDGSVAGGDAEARFLRRDAVLAVATLGRDRVGLKAERDFEAG